MFDKVSLAAEKLATNVSRRDFLGRLGRGALATAGVLGTMLAFGSETRAGSCPPGQVPVRCLPGVTICCPASPQPSCIRVSPGRFECYHDPEQ